MVGETCCEPTSGRRVDWLHLGWTILITLYAIQYWVGIWPYRDIEFHYKNNPLLLEKS